MRKFFLWVFLILISSTGKGQSFEQLQYKWIHTKNDTDKIKAGIELHEKFYKQFDDSVIVKTKLLETMYLQSLKCNHSQGIIYSGFYLGNCYIYLNNTPLAIKYYLISLKESEKRNKIFEIARAKMGIGLVHFTLNNYPMAVKFFKSSLSLNKILKVEKQIARQQYLIGFSLISLNDFNTAKYYIDSSIIILKKLNDSIRLMECRLGLANIYKGQKKYDSATFFYRSLIPGFIKINEWFPVANIYSSLAEIAFNEGQYQDAMNLVLEAKKYSDRVSNVVPKKNVSEMLYKINWVTGHHKEAYIHLLRFNSLKDSIINLDFVSQISVAEATYDFEKEQANAKAEQERRESHYKAKLELESKKQTALGLFAILATLMVIVIVFAYRWVSRQKQVSEGLLLNILPQQTAEELKKHGKSLPKSHSGVSIMFCDIKNFSHIAEQLSPEHVVEMLDYYFKNFDTIIEELGVEKIKTIGDAYMCCGGLNQLEKDTEKRVVNAAIKFLEFNSFVEKEMLEKYGQAFYFRIGIHTGNVVSGVVGRKKFTYDIWGDAVNIAARMEQNSVPGRINISGDTYELVKNDFDCEYRGKIAAKNKGEIDMYFVN